MAEELRLALILLGSLAIGAVVLHGIWTVRKNVQEQNPAPSSATDDNQNIDSEEEHEIQTLKIKQMEMDFNTLSVEDDESGLPVVDMDVDSIYQSEASATESNSRKGDQTQINASQNEAPMSVEEDEVLPTFSALDTPVQEEVEQIDSVLEEESFESVQPNSSNADSDEVYVEAPHSATVVKQSTEQMAPEAPAKPQREPEVLILYVDKPSGEMIDGARLLPLLLTLGFKFGEMDFFHRHEQTSGHGEILFSLANMYNPGTFDIDHMEQVQTRGLSIFMTMPNAGEALQTFNMMHNAAKKIADEFDAQVLDYKREPLDVVRVRHYVEKIRKF